MRKVLSCVVMLICVLSLTSCSVKDIKKIGQPKEVSFPGLRADDLTAEEVQAGEILYKENFESFIRSYVENLSNLEYSDLKKNIKSTEKNAERDKSYKPFVDAMKSYEGSSKELGTFKKASGKIVYTEDRKNLYLATLKVKYAKRDCKVKVQLSVDEDKETEIKSITFEPEYSFKETINKAGMNTLLGMGTVFSVLILIAFIISLFKIINKIETMAKEKEANKIKTENAKEIEKIDSAPAVVETQTDDNELIAVIAAAIAASEGSADPGSFVVRSIRKIR